MVKRKKTNKRKGQYEPIWMNSSIRKEIKKRRRYNRLKRNNIDQESEETLEKMYRTQKEKVKRLVKEETCRHEKKITDEIKQDKSRRLWDNINFLRGKDRNKNKSLETYEEDGTKLEQLEVKERMTEFWKTIYQRNENDIEEKWQNTKEEYKTSLENERIDIGVISFPYQIQEHMDYALQIPLEAQYVVPMRPPKIEIKELKDQIQKMKNKKAPGRNKVQVELYKEVIKDNTSLGKITKGINNTVQEDIIPNSWKSSITKLIPKNKKPTVKDYRPIALTDCSYKICMGIMKTKIEQHLKNNNLDNNNQFGFTAQRRTTDSTYILNCIIENEYKKKQTLIITSIDFSKAFDSVKRSKLLEVMKKFKIHPKVIDLIINVYKEDSTALTLNSREIDRLPITSGIRQGCNGSTVLFLMITYLIIEELTKLNLGVKIRDFNVTTLFFADDGLLLSNSIQDTQTMLTKLGEVGGICGLEVNKDKSYHIININAENLNNIGEIKVVNEIKYLGIIINNGRNCFKEHKKSKITKAKELAGMIMSVISKSTNKLLIGKTYWKNVALAEILYGAELMPFTKSELDEMQRAENIAYR